MDMSTMCADVQAEMEALDAILSELDEAGWNTSTPAVGWTVRDQIGHLGASDRAAAIAAGDPARFESDLRNQDRGERFARVLEELRALSGAGLLDWWRAGRGAMLDVFLTLDPKARIPWFGPAMSALSFATARLMETWAHGQDIVDALGLRRPATERLYHVAHIGVLARTFSYRVHDMEPPAEDIRVELTSPEGRLWTWGGAGARDRVTGEALDFCLVVTQRRHPADTDLRLEGATAKQWMSIAQAFAGPPGTGRRPGQFPKGR